MKSQSEQSLGVNGKLDSIPIKELIHVGIRNIRINQNHVDQGIQCIGMLLLRDVFLSPVLDQHDLLVLIAFQPFDPLFQDSGDNRNVVGFGDLQSMNDNSSRVRP